MARLIRRRLSSRRVCPSAITAPARSRCAAARSGGAASSRAIRSSALKPDCAPEPPPIDRRSFPSVARATSQPLLTSPMTSASGTNTSSKNTSLKCALPVRPLRGLTVTPGAFMSIAIIVTPACLGASGSVRTVARPHWQYWARLVHTFCPVTSQPPSTFLALVRTAAASEPASGSENSWHHMISPRSTGYTQRSRWSSVPAWAMVNVTQPVMPRSGRSTSRNSSSIANCSSTPASRPHGLGQCGTR
ncbi:Uncharacterised protein [Mycobacteroides abscessus subsp. abscessus]|nr:Uncharacterised protein [Mycobacteroides abscessus subsp. abscessus]